MTSGGGCAKPKMGLVLEEEINRLSEVVVSVNGDFQILCERLLGRRISLPPKVEQPPTPEIDHKQKVEPRGLIPWGTATVFKARMTLEDLSFQILELIQELPLSPTEEKTAGQIIQKG